MRRVVACYFVLKKWMRRSVIFPPAWIMLTVCVLLLLTDYCVCFLSHRERMWPEQTLQSSGSRKEEAVQPGAYMQCKLLLTQSLVLRLLFDRETWTILITCLRWDVMPFIFSLALFFLHRLSPSTSSRKQWGGLRSLISWQWSREHPQQGEIWSSFLLNPRTKSNIRKLLKRKQQLRAVNTTSTATVTSSGKKYDYRYKLLLEMKF